MFWHQVVLMFAVATNTHPTPETESHDFTSFHATIIKSYFLNVRWSIDCMFLAPGGAYGCININTHLAPETDSDCFCSNKN